MQNTANDVIILARSLLRDDDCNELRFSDCELLEILTREQNALISMFKENKDIISINLKGEAKITLPKKIAYIYNIRLNERPLNYALKPRAQKLENPIFIPLFGTTYGISGLIPHKEDVLYIEASFFEEVENIEDNLALDSQYNKALALGIVCECLLREISEANMQRMAFFKNELREEQTRLRAMQNVAFNKSSIETKVQY